MISVVVGAVSDFVLNCFMIPKWAAAGAAFATMIAEYLVLATQLFLGRDVVGESLKQVRYVRYGLTTAVALVPTVAATFLPVTNSFLRLVITALVFFGVYASVLYGIKDELFYRFLDNRFTRILTSNISKR